MGVVGLSTIHVLCNDLLEVKATTIGAIKILEGFGGGSLGLTRYSRRLGIFRRSSTYLAGLRATSKGCFACCLAQISSGHIAIASSSAAYEAALLSYSCLAISIFSKNSTETQRLCPDINGFAIALVRFLARP